jgi:hypothetical protein
MVASYSGGSYSTAYRIGPPHPLISIGASCHKTIICANTFWFNR